MRRILLSLIFTIVGALALVALFWVYWTKEIEGVFFVSLFVPTIFLYLTFLAWISGLVSNFSFMDFKINSSVVGSEAKVAVEEIDRTKVAALLARQEDSDINIPITFVDLKTLDWVEKHADSLSRKYTKTIEKYGPQALFFARVELNSNDPDRNFSTAKSIWEALLAIDKLFADEIFDICFVFSDIGRMNLKNQYFMTIEYSALRPNKTGPDGEESWPREIEKLARYTRDCSIADLQAFLEENLKRRGFSFSRIDRNNTTLKALIEMIIDEKYEVMVTKKGAPLNLINMSDILGDVFEKEIERRRIEKAKYRGQRSNDPNPFTVSYGELSYSAFVQKRFPRKTHELDQLRAATDAK